MTDKNKTRINHHKLELQNRFLFISKSKHKKIKRFVGRWRWRIRSESLARPSEFSLSQVAPPFVRFKNYIVASTMYQLAILIYCFKSLLQACAFKTINILLFTGFKVILTIVPDNMSRYHLCKRVKSDKVLFSEVCHKIYCINFL